MKKTNFIRRLSLRVIGLLIFAVFIFLPIEAWAAEGLPGDLSKTPGASASEVGNSAPTPTAERVDVGPIPTAEGAEQLEVLITNTYTGQEDIPRYHLVGIVTNIGDQPLTSIGLTVQITDASGYSLIKDYTGSSVPSDTSDLPVYTLWPGDSAPFDFSFDLAGTPSSYNIVVTDYWDPGSGTSRADVQVQNVKMVDGGDGYLYFSGELVNMESGWVSISSLVGAALDSNDTIVSASDASSYFRGSLAPAGDPQGRDRSPFITKIPNPGSIVTNERVFLDPHTVDAPTNWLDVQLTNRYNDSNGYFHVVGWLTNNGSEGWVTDSVVVGLYDQEGMVINVGWDWLFNIYLAPDSRIPFDAATGYTIGTPLDIALVDHMTVLSDGFRSSHLDVFEYVTLYASDEQVQRDGADWTITGNVINTSDKNLRDGDVKVAVYNAGGNLVAMGEDSIFSTGERITPGETIPYEVEIKLDPNADTTGYTTETFVQAWYGRSDEQGTGLAFRPSGPLVPELTTYIPRPSDISTKPGVIGGNLFLAALIMLPFAVATELFTRTLAANEESLRRKFKPVDWLGRLENWMGKRTASHLRHPVLRDVLKLLGVMFFYGLAFSLLDRTFLNPISTASLSLFVYMTLAYGLVGVADDIMQWRALRKWGQEAELSVRPTNILLAVVSTSLSRLFSLVPGLMFGTPEALSVHEATLDADKRSRLLKISAVTFTVIVLAFWIPTILTGLLQRLSLSETTANLIGGVEAFLLVIFAVALENTFVQMLGFPGGFGQALKKKNRWLWLGAMVGISFLFLHTLLNPRGELAEAMKESNVILFLGVSGAFVVVAVVTWFFFGRKGESAASLVEVIPSEPKPERPVRKTTIGDSITLRTPRTSRPVVAALPEEIEESRPAPTIPQVPVQPYAVSLPKRAPEPEASGPVASPLQKESAVQTIVGQTKDCPSCGQTIKAEARLCRHCRAHFEIHTRGYCQASCHQAVDITEEKCSRCGGEVMDMHVVSRLVSKPARPPVLPTAPVTEVEEGSKLCPHCGQTIKAEARLCRFCRTRLDTDTQQPAAPLSAKALSPATPLPQTEPEAKNKIKAERLYQDGLRLVRQEQFRQAIPLLEEAANLNPISAAIHQVLGFSYSQVVLEYPGDERAMNSWMDKAADTFWKAITLHRQYGGLEKNQLISALEMVAAVDRVKITNSNTPPEDQRRTIFYAYQSTSSRQHRSSGAEEKAIAHVTKKFHVTERQLRAMIQEAKKKQW